ncbi:hypothetical protein FYL09_08615 [Lactobacillus salivarius]|uniref:hypothetical protein n=1 Tax=Ligilactobacillus salivarius TaxID=1624 RepID=UPI0013720CCB|nr:hypothetical protein [Ligilactobacillus salivarius]MYU78597.1 hypothetical protein [Ligilactobacillus salivarius]MYZ65173.1 hypothetical protein [Ligilactobacillus salivarius]
MATPLYSSNDKNIPANTPIESDSQVLYNKDGNSSDGGGGNMNNDYVTHPELKLSEEETQRKLDNLDSKITQVDNKLDYKFNELDKKIDSKFDLLNTKIDSLTKLVWWIIGLLTTGVVLPAIAYFVKTIFLK